MQNFTPDEFAELFNKSQMFNDAKSMAEEIEQEKIEMAPRASVIDRIVGYNRALSVRTSKHVEHIEIILN